MRASEGRKKKGRWIRRQQRTRSGGRQREREREICPFLLLLFLLLLLLPPSGQNVRLFNQLSQGRGQDNKRAFLSLLPCFLPSIPFFPPPVAKRGRWRRPRRRGRMWREEGKERKGLVFSCGTGGGSGSGGQTEWRGPGEQYV